MRQLGTLGDVPKAAEALEQARAAAPDMQTPEFWRRVWR